MDFLELQTYARIRTKTEQNFAITDEALRFYLNMSLGALYSIIASDYEDYFSVKYLATLNGNTGNQIPVPPDFYKLRAVDFGGPGFWTTVYGFMLEERNRMNNPIANMASPYGNLAARKVRTMGNKVFVEPEALCQGQYQVWYIPKFHPLVLDTDKLIPAMDTNGWIEYAVCATGVKIYNALGLQPDGFMMEMKEHETMVRNDASNRMSNGPQAMVNTRNVSDWSFGGGFGGYGG